ncbi:CLUMA_CG006795, isoform A [Clunio marinus]|uniref:CLUMA_CG006795, isoform A n=1 Tax=Clunio marinus TaxID=568069 RepID=A0A1J1I0Z1_9DIPT|nr:CLUMA_CG006795, isoform A [Clunio marinus]
MRRSFELAIEMCWSKEILFMKWNFLKISKQKDEWKDKKKEQKKKKPHDERKNVFAIYHVYSRNFVIAEATRPNISSIIITFTAH